MNRLVTVKGWNGKRRLAVEFHVKWGDVRDPDQIFTRRPGRFFFRGAWNGRDLTKQKTYGKVEGQVGLPIGKLSGRPSSFLLKKLR
jgi:hypothetical protein